MRWMEWGVGVVVVVGIWVDDAGPQLGQGQGQGAGGLRPTVGAQMEESVEFVGGCS